MFEVFYVKHCELNDIYQIKPHPFGYTLCTLFNGKRLEWTREALNTSKSFEKVYKDCKDNPFNIVSEDLESILAIRELTS